MSDILEYLKVLPQGAFDSGAVLMEEGIPCGKLYVLISGSVEILKGNTRIAKSKAPGAVFGEMSLLLDCPPTGTVKTLEPSTFIVIDGTRDFLHRHPEFCLHVASLLAARLDSVTRYLADLKSQYEGNVGVGMVDEILETLLHHQPKSAMRAKSGTG